MARVKARLLRRALFSTRTHVADEDNLWTPLCGRKGSYRVVTYTSAPLCKDCLDAFTDLHPRTGLYTHVTGLEADEEIEERLDELASENSVLRARLDQLERATGEVRPIPKAPPRVRNLREKPNRGPSKP